MNAFSPWEAFSLHFVCPLFLSQNLSAACFEKPLRSSFTKTPLKKSLKKQFLDSWSFLLFSDVVSLPNLGHHGEGEAPGGAGGHQHNHLEQLIELSSAGWQYWNISQRTRDKLNFKLIWLNLFQEDVGWIHLGNRTHFFFLHSINCIKNCNPEINKKRINLTFSSYAAVHNSCNRYDWTRACADRYSYCNS